MTIRKRVIAILARQAVVDPARVRSAMTMDELGLDSLGLVEVIFAIEEEFDISVPFNANDPAEGGFDTATVGTIIAAVEKLAAERV